METMRGNRCDAGETRPQLVLGHIEATALGLRAWFGVSVGWFPFAEVARHVSPSSIMPRQKSGDALMRLVAA